MRKIFNILWRIKLSSAAGCASLRFGRTERIRFDLRFVAFESVKTNFKHALRRGVKKLLPPWLLHHVNERERERERDRGREQRARARLTVNHV